MDKDPYDRLEPLLPETDELGIEGYETIAPLGEGGFGRVFRAHQAAFRRDVAIKVLAASALKDETVRRFERECRAIGTLSGHPNIVTIYDSGVSRWGRPYIVMDYMAGGSFGNLLTSTGTVALQSAVETIIKIAGAVETAHRAGILHRDIKPENILLSSYGEPKLADFGVASIPGGYQTHTGAITASLAHAAPEVLEGHRATRAVDVYALGSTLFAMIDGRPAFSPTEDGGLQSLIARTLTRPVPDLRSKGVPDDVCRVIETAMAKDPSARYDSAEDLAVALQKAQSAAGWIVTDMPVERTAIVAYPSEPAGPADPRTRIRNRRELTPPQPMAAPKRVVWRSPIFSAALVLLLAISSGSFIALRARDRTTPLPIVSPRGEATDPAAEREEEPDPEPEPPRRRRTRPQTDRRGERKPSSRSGGNLSFAGSAGGGYSVPPSSAGGGSYSPPSPGGSAGGGSNSDAGGTGGGGGDGGSSPPKPPPQPAGSAKPPDLAFWHLWNDDGSYIFTTDFETAQNASGAWEHRARLGEVWSSSRTGDDLAPLCMTQDRCGGYVAEGPPKEGSYLTLYWHGGGEYGRFFSTNPSATYRGQPLTRYGYIRPPG